MSTFDIPAQGQNGDDEISLAEIVSILWTGRWLLAVVMIVAAVLSAIVAYSMTPLFESSVVLSPVADEGEGSRFSGASSLLSQFGGLSALGGINFSSSNRKSEAIATLQSRALTQTYISEKNLLPVLFPHEWDEKTKAWKESDPKKQPTLWKGERYFSSAIRRVVEDKKTGLVTMTIIWKDPVVAATWANDVVLRANQYLRQKSIDQSNRNIGYLNDQLGRTSVVELQKAIYGLVESEIKKVMIAQGSDEYAFKVVDAAVAPETRSSPKRKFIIIMGTLGAMLVASLFLFVRGRVSRPAR